MTHTETRIRPAQDDDLDDRAGTTDEDDLLAGAARWSPSRARAIVARFAEVTTTQDVDTFVAGFTDDCEIHYAPYPPVRGHDGVRQLIERHFSPDRAGFVCRKQLRAISGDVLGVVWCNSWTDRRTGRAMRSKGVEFWRMRGDRIARWDAAAVAWPDPADRDS